MRTPAVVHAVAPLVAALVAAPVAAVTGGEWSGYVAAQGQWFAAAPLDSRQRRHAVSVAAEPEYYVQWGGGDHSLVFKPFVRLDSADDERTHIDLRELMWQHVGDGFELRAGVGKVFWGVTESQHLVDVINQTDLVESPDGEEKLGQPMANLALIEDWGTVNLFVLPGFRERTFAGVEGRLRSQPRVDTDHALYESGAGRGHVDVAMRYSHYFGNVDVGLSHFYGTSREPRFVPALDGGGAPVLRPLYERIHQTGLDLQYTEGAWLWKLEAIRRSGQGSPYHAATGGFEHTLFGVLGSAIDVGVIGEYLYDERGSAGPALFQHDVLAGVRVAFNDVQSTDALFGVITDLDDGTKLFSLEASRRLGDAWKLSIEARVFADVGRRNPTFALRRDDYLQLELAHYF